MTYEETKLKIDELKDSIAMQGKLTDDQLKKINYKFRLEWNYNSNSMEGNTLTVAETRSVMVGNLDVRQKPINDVLEMKGHDEIISEILKIGKGELRLSEKRIMQIHSAIMHEDDEIRKNQIGIWKTEQNEIINYKGEKFTFTHPDEVREKIHNLLNRTNASLDAVFANKKNAPHPLDIAFDFHLDFLTIHPFHDGNGRVSRILTNLILIALGYPPFWINKQERNVYYKYIADIQTYGGDRKLLDAYVAELVLRSQQLVADVIEGKDIEDEDDIYKEITLWKSHLSKDTKLVTKNNIVVANEYINSIKPLLDSFLSKIIMFDDVFEKKSITNIIDGIQFHADCLSKFNQTFIEILDEFKETKSIVFSDAYNTIKLEVNLKGFKRNGTNTFNLGSIIEVQFSEYGYAIRDKRVGENFAIRKLYEETLTSEEINLFVKSSISKLFEDIKLSIKN